MNDNEAYIGIYMQETVDNAKDKLLRLMADGKCVCDSDMDDLAAALSMDEDVVGPYEVDSAEELDDAYSLMDCTAFKSVFVAVMGYDVPNTAVAADTAIRKFCLAVCREEIYAWYMSQVFMKSVRWE